MKKFAIGIFAVAFAIIGFAFSTEKKAQTQYVWLEVLPGTGIACNNFASVTPNDLILVPRAPGQTAIQSLVAAGHDLTKTEAINFFDCPASQFVCAVGYELVEGNFQFVTINGVQYVKPLGAAVKQDKICRTTE